MNEVEKDPRFAHIVKDARFKRLPRKHVKVKVDKRFQSMFTDKKFQIKCRVDKRGRPVNVDSSEDLKRYYDLSDSEENLDDDDIEKNKYTDDDDESDGNDINEDEHDNDIDENQESVEKVKHKSGNKIVDNESLLSDKQKYTKSDNREKTQSATNEAFDKESEPGRNNDHNKLLKPRKETLVAEIKRKLRNSKIDYARGEGTLISDSSSEEEDEPSDAEVSENEEHDWGELDNDADTTEEATNRLAICNMDWDRIKAKDLMVLFHSFLPAGGLIYSITIYPSDYGTKKMKEEEENGPSELKELVTEKEDEEMDREQMEKLRKYQLNRLKYYYAVMVCDNKETANALYKECDGLEYESSAVKLDLRFVPEDTIFEQEPKDTCTCLPDLSTYKPRLFQTTALTRSKVELTWDENDPEREDIVRSVHKGNIDEDQLKQYLAYSSSDEEDDGNTVLMNETVDVSPDVEQNPLEKYKALLADIESKEKKKKSDQINLEVTWNLKLENKANEIVKEKMKSKENLTPFQQYIQKKKEKQKKKKLERKAQIEEIQKDSEESAFSDDDIPSDIDLNDPYFKEEFDQMKKKKDRKKKSVQEISETEEDKMKKAELELLMLDGESENKHFNYKKIEENENTKNKKKKGLKRKVEAEPVDDFKIDVNDERFSAIYSSHHYNIDPTDPQFRPTKATKELIEEKLKRRALDEPVEKSQKLNEKIGKNKISELNALVKTIKKNTVDMKKYQ